MSCSDCERICGIVVDRIGRDRRVTWNAPSDLLDEVPQLLEEADEEVVRVAELTSAPDIWKPDQEHFVVEVFKCNFKFLVRYLL